MVGEEKMTEIPSLVEYYNKYQTTARKSHASKVARQPDFTQFHFHRM
jgi:hypothetical protein